VGTAFFEVPRGAGVIIFHGSDLITAMLFSQIRYRPKQVSEPLFICFYLHVYEAALKGRALSERTKRGGPEKDTAAG